MNVFPFSIAVTPSISMTSGGRSFEKEEEEEEEGRERERKALNVPMCDTSLVCH